VETIRIGGVDLMPETRERSIWDEAATQKA